MTPFLTTGWIHRSLLKKNGVRFWSGVEYLEIGRDGFRIRQAGEEIILAVDNVVICAGQVSERGLAVNSRPPAGHAISSAGPSRPGNSMPSGPSARGWNWPTGCELGCGRVMDVPAASSYFRISGTQFVLLNSTFNPRAIIATPNTRSIQWLIARKRERIIGWLKNRVIRLNQKSCTIMIQTP